MKEFMIETSARHVHVTQETLEVLFGAGFELTVKKMLSQPGQYASEQKVKVVGPRGELACSILGPVRKDNQVELTEGVIVAKRHIHMTPSDAEEFGVKDKDIVSVKVVNNTGRNVTFHDTVVRVSPTYALAMHIDTDEANAGALSGAVTGVIVK